MTLELAGRVVQLVLARHQSPRTRQDQTHLQVLYQIARASSVVVLLHVFLGLGFVLTMMMVEGIM